MLHANESVGARVALQGAIGTLILRLLRPAIAAMLAQDNSFTEADCPARFGELQATQSKGNHLRVKPERPQPIDCDRGPPRARANGNLAIAYGP